MEKSGLLKYNLLYRDSQNEVKDFIDFLLIKIEKKRTRGKDSPSYKEKILSVSVWSEEDTQVFDHNRKLLNQWQPTKEW